MLIQFWILIVFAITVIFTSVAFASPFDSFENELKEYIDSESGQYYEGEDSQIKELFHLMKKVPMRQRRVLEPIPEYHLTISFPHIFRLLASFPLQSSSQRQLL